MRTDNKQATIRNILDQLFSAGNLNIIEDAFSPSFIAFAGNKEYKGHDFLKKYTKQLQKCIPDIKVTNVEFLLENNERISWHRTLTGNHKANMQGIPASNKKITWLELVVTEFSDGRISKDWIVTELMVQLLLYQR
mgnify:CR=1 FL=1